MTEQVQLHERPGGNPRCAVCHDEAGGERVVCTGCGTEFHLDCRRSLEKCPTLGCVGKVEPVPLERLAQTFVPEPGPLSLRRALVASVPTFAFLALCFGGLFFAQDKDAWRPVPPFFPVSVVAHLLGLPLFLAWRASRPRERERNMGMTAAFQMSVVIVPLLLFCVLDMKLGIQPLLTLLFASVEPALLTVWVLNRLKLEPLPGEAAKGP